MSGCRQHAFEMMTTDHVKPDELVQRFYALRRNGDPESLRPLIHEEVVWREPEVEGHMGELRGADAVIDMIRRALETTGGSFRLEIQSLVATDSDCAAVIGWRADKDGKQIEGRELAVFRFASGLIREAMFFPESIADDHAFWA